MTLVQHFRVTRSRASKMKNKDDNAPVTIKTTPTNMKKRNIQETVVEVVTARKRQRSMTPKTPAASKKRFGFSSDKKTPIGHATSTTPLKAKAEEDAFLQHEVGLMYKLIRKQTGRLGGNAAGGAIYGEITQKSFQRVIDYLKEHCDFTAQSTFIDIGSGLGKPNFHASIDPGVKVSYGVELETLRWQLSLHNLKSVLKSPVFDKKQNTVMFTAGDITDAETFDPFTHVYSFDVGFPPDVMDYMAKCFNRSTASFLVSFHPPRKIIDMYGYHVTNIGRILTSMAGSSEGHSCYVYERIGTAKKTSKKSDTLFKSGIDLLTQGNQAVLDWISAVTGENEEASKSRRHARQARARKEPGQLSMMSFCRTIPPLKAN